MRGTELTDEQVERYSRQIILQEVGGEGQKKLLRARVLVVGAGGLGSPALLYLAGAGVGKLGIADGDAVEISNFQRQIIHRTADLGKNKAVSAEEAVRALNPDCEVEVLPQRLSVANIREVIRRHDAVLDCSDNFPTRFLVADCCRFENVPLVSAAVIRFEGQLMVVLPGQGNPCYRCFIPAPPPAGLVPTCQQAGILGAVAGVMGALQAMEALKLILGTGGLLSHELLIYDGLRCAFRTAKRTPDPACPLCGAAPSITRLVEYPPNCAR